MMLALFIRLRNVIGAFKEQDQDQDQWLGGVVTPRFAVLSLRFLWLI